MNDKKILEQLSAKTMQGGTPLGEFLMVGGRAAMHLHVPRADEGLSLALDIGDGAHYVRGVRQPFPGAD